MQRQLLAAAAALAIACSGAAQSPEPPVSTAQEELQAAKLLGTALRARNASPKEWQKLDEIYAELAVKHPGNAAILNARAELLWQLDERSRAIKLWEQAAEIEPENPAVLNHLGGALIATGQPLRAVSYFERAIKAEPANPLSHFNLANVCFLFRHELKAPEEEVFARSLTHFAEATRLSPANADYARAYAETFYVLPKPDWKAALAAWERFHEITMQKDFALSHIARVHMKLGDKAAARAALAKIESPEYSRLKARLKERMETE